MIFAYVAIAVYDSVMAIEGGYEPFAVDVDAPDAPRPRRPSPRRRTASSRTTSRRRGHDHRSCVHGVPRDDPRRRGEDERDRGRRSRREPPHRTALGRRLPGERRRTRPRTRRSRASGSRLPPRRRSGRISASCGRSPRVRRSVPTRPAARPRQQAVGRRVQRGEGDRLARHRTTDPEQTEAARFWAEAPVQQARGSFRKFVLDHELDVTTPRASWG